MTLLHFVHDAGTSDVPHWPQKREPCGLIVLHCGHGMALAEGVGLRPQSWPLELPRPWLLPCPWELPCPPLCPPKIRP